MNRTEVDALHVMLLRVVGDPGFAALSEGIRDELRAALRFTAPSHERWLAAVPATTPSLRERLVRMLRRSR